MNYTLQLHGERVVYPVPPGLGELMSDISRQVLRDQPTLLYSYIANYLETLIKVREYARRAGRVVGDVLGENRELLAYAHSLGISWQEANSAARKVQGAFKIYKAKKEMRQKLKARRVSDIVDKSSHLKSESFQDYLNSMDVKVDDRSRRSSLHEELYQAYMAKKKVDEELKVKSTHTIEAISPKPPSRLKSDKKKKPLKRDSKLLVYQQSPNHSVVSTWSTLARQIEEEEAKQKLALEQRSLQLLYKQSPTIEVSHPKYLTSSFVSRSHHTDPLKDKFPLPSYYDESKSKVAMISDSGELVQNIDNDIVTLFSTESVDLKRIRNGGGVKLPSVSSLPLHQSKTQMAKEMFEIIEKRSEKTSSIIQSAGSLDRSAKEQFGIKKGLSKITVPGPESESFKASSRTIPANVSKKKQHI